MNFRTKTAGIVAALALTLTLTGGIASADSTAGANTSAALKDKPGAVGCTIMVSGGTSINFGDFTWNGSGYSGTPGQGSFTLTRSDDRAPGKPNCSPVQVLGTGLSSVTTTQEAFPVGAIMLNTGQALTAGSLPLTTIMGANTITVNLTASMVNNAAAPATDYKGSITFTQANGL
ncbi:MAG: hypothetical protein ACR2OU_15600 [Thermomicrobiales bacterium]